MGRRAKYRNIHWLLIFTAAFLCSPGQILSQSDTTLRIQHDVIIPVSIDDLSNISIFKDTCKKLLPSQYRANPYYTVYGSIRNKASKYIITKKIYDIVVVNPDTLSGKKQANVSSESDYEQFSGKIIRRIEVRRLSVFGESVDYPSTPDRLEQIINKSHISTSESIIRNNLLFSKGDTVSPLKMSDNERVLRDLSYIDDARITLIPVSDNEVDVIVTTKDIYSLGGSYKPNGLKAGAVSVFENNLFGMGHELGLSIPYNSSYKDSPGFGMHYLVDNIGKSFVNLNLYYSSGLGEKTYGLDLSRRLVSTTSKYAGGISIRQMYKSVDLDTMKIPEPLNYNFQDYWFSRSFLINNIKANRVILGVRYTNNNVFDRPFIFSDSFHAFQKYRFLLGSAALSVQRFYKANLIYGYGRTEDIPYGGLIKVTLGKEINEFKTRNYAGSEIAYGNRSSMVGYFYSAAGLASYINSNRTEQGIAYLKLKYFSNLTPIGRFMIRNFINIDYTRGFDRNSDEHLTYMREAGLTGFRNDSVQGAQRLTLNLETVVFSPVNVYGFRFAFFGFADFSSLAGTNEVVAHGTTLSGIGLGVRIRNDNLIFNTFQIRFGFFPNPPPYSRINYMTVSGEQLLRPSDFESGPPSVIPYR